MNVTRCAYHEMMVRMEAGDIGQVLICNLGFAIAERARIELKRTQICIRAHRAAIFATKRAADSYEALRDTNKQVPDFVVAHNRRYACRAAAHMRPRVARVAILSEGLVSGTPCAP
jgi:hypothetical protein